MKMIIGGKHVDSSDGKQIEIINPASSEVVDVVPSATQRDIDIALDNARTGFEEWSKVPLYKRIEILKRFTRLCVENAEEIAQLLTKEMGKPITQSRGEVMAAVSKAESFIEGARFVSGETVCPENRAGTDGNLVLTVHEPLGVVVGIVPFNYPVITLTTKLIPALVMGNAFIAKPPTDVPLSSIRWMELLLEAGVAPNAAQIVTGRGCDIGKMLASDKRVDGINFTGSTATGAEIASAAGKTVKRLSLELGGNDAVIILPDADLEKAVSESIGGRLANCGQICCATKRFIVHNSIKARFIQRLGEELKKVKIGEPSEEETQCGPMVSENAAALLEQQLKLNVEQGAKIILGGSRYDKAYFELTIMEADEKCEAIRDMELFGPVWTVIGFDTTDEAIALANGSIYGLSSAVMGSDINELLKCAKSMRAGTCVVNGSSFLSSEDSPFGGYKQSGIGRECIKASLEAFTEVKTIILKNLF